MTTKSKFLYEVILTGVVHWRYWSVCRYLEYPKTVGMASYYGLDYEVALCSLLFMRGVNQCWSRELDAFFLASNHADAGLFDDVVLVRSSRDRYDAVLVQVKHKNSCKVNSSSRLRVCGCRRISQRVVVSCR